MSSWYANSGLLLGSVSLDRCVWHPCPIGLRVRAQTHTAGTARAPSSDRGKMPEDACFLERLYTRPCGCQAGAEGLKCVRAPSGIFGRILMTNVDAANRSSLRRQRIAADDHVPTGMSCSLPVASQKK